MAPAPSKYATPETTAPRKRKASSRITDENFVGAETNIVTKRLKQSADAHRAAAAAAEKKQLSVQEDDSEDILPLINLQAVLKRSADAARARALAAIAEKKRKQRQPSVQEVDDDLENTVPLKTAPKNPHIILEAANGSDDVEMLDSDPVEGFNAVHKLKRSADAARARALAATAAKKRKQKQPSVQEEEDDDEDTVPLKRLADAAQARALAATAAKKRKHRQPSVQEEDDDDEDTVPLKIAPKNPHAILEAANGSDDAEMLDSKEEDVKPETAEEQLSKSKQSKNK
jgi:hypothetical protein